MTQLVQQTNNETDVAVLSALKSSLYTGAKDDSIQMVIEYCKACKLDPMQKPVHIVPMWDKNTKSMKDTIMPGIGLYRIQAARSNKYAGVSEPEYGDTVNTTLGGVSISYPEWCKVTVKKLVGNNIVEFTAKEYWLENYATARKDSTAPNAMWLKRPFGQLAKCAEAQALRKAFPEIITQQPTAEEMEGKSFAENTKTVVENNTSQNALERYIEDEKTEYDVTQDKVILNKYFALQELIELHNVPQETVDLWLQKAQVESIDKLPEEKIDACIDYIEKKF
ncbi:MAG: phage recombination protein Bet [Candidatus Brocadiaceae bacterium]|nr:phage recombination protein Bet [Candidatus Brocadiaceae bacterium]